MEESKQPQAIPFISFNQKGEKFELNPEASEFIAKIKGPIGICSVAGMYRTGKSYLLNRMLLDRSNGFGVGPTINPCTKGLWIWNEPIQGTTPEGEPISVLVVDTEGLGAFDETQNHDVRIFTLAILLSSYFIYNSMGSIDETSLNQLSLVVNLTKHIQLSASGCRSPGEIDPEEYAKIFPSFMWVVRDFALKLSDENDIQITSKEYLERALLEQKGFSDSVEQKNRIRRLLKTFFTDRDCCTMIRPVNQESELQNLGHKNMNELRSEFQEQVKILRRKVLGKIKPKSMNGKQLTGEIIVSLAGQYVESINKGAVPNIESAWHYICQNQCQKITEESLQLFRNHFDSKIVIPCDESLFETHTKIAFKMAKEHFDKNSFGQEISDFKTELKKKCIEYKSKQEQQNYWLTQQQFSQFLQQQYESIEISLRSGQIENFQQFKSIINEFLQFVDEQSPPGSKKCQSELLRDFVQTSVIQAAEIFNQTQQQQTSFKLAIQEEKLKQVEGRNSELKKEYLQTIDELKQHQRSLEKERADLLAEDSIRKQTLQSLREESQRAIESKEKQISSMMNDCKTQLAQKEELLQVKINQAQDAQRQLFQVQSEGEKQIALLEQKMDFLNQKYADNERKLQQITSEKIQLEKSSLENIKALSQKFELDKSHIQQKLDEAQEQIFELNQLMSQTEDKHKSEQTLISNQSKQFQAELIQANEQILILQTKVERVGDATQDQLEELQNKLSTEISQREMIEKSSKRSILEIQETMGQKVKDLEKELALVIQKNQFAKEEITSLQKQLVERSQSHDTILKAIESKSTEYASAKDLAEEKIRLLEQDYNEKLSQNQKQFETQIENLQTQNADLNIQKNSLESVSRLDAQEAAKEIKNLQAQLFTSEKAREQAEMQLKLNEKTTSNALFQTNEEFAQKISNLEIELETQTQQHEALLAEVQQKAESQLLNLKLMYESERQRLELRITEEKEQSKRKHQQLTDEYETRIRDEQTQREEDIEMLQSDIRENENRHQNTIKQLEYDNQLLHQTLQTNSEHARESEERLQRELHITSQQLAIGNERSNQERSEFQTKIQDAMRAEAQKEQKIASLLVQISTLNQQIEGYQQQTDEMKGSAAIETSKLVQKIEEQKNKIQQLSDEQLRQKLDDGREIALYKQRIEFQDRKIEDQSKQIDQITQNYEERLKQLKTDSQQELIELQNRTNFIKEQLEEKFEVKRRKYKDTEQALTKQISEQQKEKELSEQLLQSVINQQNQKLQKLETEITSMGEQNQRLQDQIQGEREQYQTEIDRVKLQLNEIERDHCELQNNSERDKALLEGKCQFLEQQRDQAKQDYLEASRKFEQTLDQIQKRGHFEKDRTESSQSAMLTSLEMKFKKQLQEQIDEKQKIQFENEEAIAALQKVNRDIKLEIQLAERDRQNLKRQLETTIEEYQTRENELRQLLQISQSEKDSKSSNYTRTLEREREHLKQKCSEAEIKLKETESKGRALMFELEKEKTRFAMEKEQLNNKSAQLMENIEGLERQKEQLLKECEKLKQTRKSNLTLGKQSNGLAYAKSPSRYGQPSVTPQHNFEPSHNQGQLSKSIFISGMSKALLAGQGSDTSSQRSLDLGTITAPIQIKSSENQQRTLSNASLSTLQKPARVNVINFDLNRTKARLSNITNTVKKSIEDEDAL